MNRPDDNISHDATTPEPNSARSPLPAAAPAFHSDDVEHLASYQSLSVLAIVSLLIGLASPLSIVSKVFLLLPLAGALVALIALGKIAASGGRLAGRGVALAALVLCVVSGSTAVARDYVIRSMRAAQAEQFAHQWLTRIASGELQQAFKITYDGARPLAPPEPGAPPPPKTPYESFLDDPFVKRISAAGKDARIQHRDTLDFIPQSHGIVTVRQRFLVTPASTASNPTPSEPIEALLTVQRARYSGFPQPRWLVMRFELPNHPPE